MKEAIRSQKENTNSSTMGRKRMKWLLPLFAALSVGCSSGVAYKADSSGFASEVLQDFEGEQEADGRYTPDQETYQVIEGGAKQTFRLGQSSDKPLDIVWVIDNSGSMSEESDHVRSNFAKFIARVSGDTALKVALVSQKEGQGKNGVTLDEQLNPENFVQINREIASHEALLAAAEVSEGELAGFFRQDAQKAFVFVTDDESEDLAASAFRARVAQIPGGRKFSAYSFIALGEDESPCGSGEGAEYVEASKMSGGEVFNICEEDWSSHFETLADSVIAQVQDTVQLRHIIQIEDIISIKVNGQFIESSDYVLSGDRIRIVGGLLNPAIPNTLEVVYRLP